MIIGKKAKEREGRFFGTKKRVAAASQVTQFSLAPGTYTGLLSVEKN